VVIACHTCLPRVKPYSSFSSCCGLFVTMIQDGIRSEANADIRAAAATRSSGAHTCTASSSDAEPTRTQPVAASSRTPPPPSSAGSAPQGDFHVGMHVTVQGVVARPELNGRTGVCQSFDHKSGRWTIRFDLDDTLVKLQAEKLRALAQVLQPHARAERPLLPFASVCCRSPQERDCNSNRTVV
jgi:hypothetical protein